MSRTGILQAPRSVDSDVDRYIKESSKSFKECNIKNNARRNSLQKKTLGIEVQRKMASAELSREERMLRDQLKQMNIEKMKHTLVHNIRAQKNQKGRSPKDDRIKCLIPIEPYPVTLRNQTPSPVDLDKQLKREGSMYARTRGRRQSKELEDLKLDTDTGTFLTSREDSDLDAEPRRRVYSMSITQNPKLKKKLGFSSSVSTPRTSPGLRRKVLSARGSPSSGSSATQSRESLNNCSSLDDLHWAGDPEAIHSVRRPRRTVEEQELETEIHKSRSKKHSQ